MNFQGSTTTDTKSLTTSSSLSTNEVDIEIKATIIENNDNIIMNFSNHYDNNVEKVDANGKVNKSRTVLRNFDTNKIQSNTKDITDDSGDNIINSNRKISVVTVPPVVNRSTMRNRFSNNGGNGLKVDDIEILNGDGAVRKRHKRKRQGR